MAAIENTSNLILTNPEDPNCVDERQHDIDGPQDVNKFFCYICGRVVDVPFSYFAKFHKIKSLIDICDATTNGYALLCKRCKKIYGKEANFGTKILRCIGLEFLLSEVFSTHVLPFLPHRKVVELITLCHEYNAYQSNSPYWQIFLKRYKILSTGRAKASEFFHLWTEAARGVYRSMQSAINVTGAWQTASGYWDIWDCGKHSACTCSKKCPIHRHLDLQSYHSISPFKYGKECTNVCWYDININCKPAGIGYCVAFWRVNFRDHRDITARNGGDYTVTVACGNMSIQRSLTQSFLSSAAFHSGWVDLRLGCVKIEDSDDNVTLSIHNYTPTYLRRGHIYDFAYLLPVDSQHTFDEILSGDDVFPICA